MLFWFFFDSFDVFLIIFFCFKGQYLRITGSIHINGTAFSTAAIKALIHFFNLFNAVSFWCINCFTNRTVDPALDHTLYVSMCFWSKLHCCNKETWKVVFICFWML